MNGTAIERTERYGADIDFLKRYGLEYHAAIKENTLVKIERSFFVTDSAVKVPRLLVKRHLVNKHL